MKNNVKQNIIVVYVIYMIQNIKNVYQNGIYVYAIFYQKNVDVCKKNIYVFVKIHKKITQNKIYKMINHFQDYQI